MNEQCGIYSITNKINGKVYIGYTEAFNTRIYNHKKELKDRRHKNYYLTADYEKYGDVFKYERIELCNKELLIEREHYWAILLNTHNKEYGYNIQETGLNRSSGMKGRKHSEETKKKISESRKGKLRGIDNPSYGKPLSQEHRKKISDKLMGRVNTLVGYKHSDESRKKMSQAHIGIKKSEQCKNKLRKHRCSDPNMKNHMLRLREMRYVPVMNIDDKGGIIKEYKTAKEASIENNIDNSWLIKCCKSKGKKKTFGKIWIYKVDYGEYIKQKV